MNKDSKIALFFPSFNIGGVERVMVDIANTLYCFRYNIYIIICYDKGDLKNDLLQEINVIVLNKRIRNCLVSLIKVLSVEKFDYLLSGPDFPNFIAVFASRFVKFPLRLYLTQHNLFNIESKRLGLHGRIVPILYRCLYPKADRIIAVSNATLAMLRTMNLSSEKLIKINNPIDIDEIQCKSRLPINMNVPDNYIVFVGRLSFVKNIPLLIRAFKIVVNEHPDLFLLIVGNGEEYGEWKKLTKSMNLNDKILFVGSQSNPYPFLKNSRLLVLPSLSEAFPCILLEAMSLGLTVVTTATSGGLECTDGGRYGYICESFTDEKVLAKIILKALDCAIDKNELESRAKQFDCKAIAKEYAALMRN